MVVVSLRGKWLLFKTQHSQLKRQLQQAFLKPSRRNNAVVPDKFATDIVTKERRIFDGRILTADSGSPLPQHVILLHGGAYAMQGIASHREIMEALIHQANLRITYVDFPLVPEATVDQTLIFTLNVYDYLRAQYPDDQFFLLGDSAGGGLALAVLQQLRAQQKPMPAGSILISPWTDLSMMNPDLQAAARHDPYLTLETLKQIGYAYAGDHAVTDPRVSPIYGSFDELGPILMYFGTNELLHADDQRLLQKLREAQGTPVAAHEMRAMLHDYLLWTKLPESKRTLKAIKQFILTGQLE